MAVPVRGPGLFLSGADCLRLAGPLARYIAEQARRDGGVPPRLREIAEAVLATGQSYRAEMTGPGVGTSGFRDDQGGASCATSATWLTVERTAELLGCSTEYVRRLCRQRALHSVRAAGGGAWLVDEAAVLERLGARSTKAA